MALGLVSSSLFVPWWPIVSSLCGSYLSGDFPTMWDMGVLVCACASLVVSFAILLCLSKAKRQAAPGISWQYAVSGTVVGLALFWVAAIPTEVSGLLLCMASVCVCVACACATIVFRSCGAMPAGWKRIVEITAPAAVASVALLMGFVLDKGTVLILSTVSTCVSIATTEALRHRPCPSPRPTMLPATAPTPNRLLEKMRLSCKLRLFASPACTFCPLAAMSYLFLSAGYDRLPVTCFASGCTGIAIFIVFCAGLQLLRHCVEGTSVYRMTMVVALLAFFPMDPGSSFSIRFAVIFTLAACFAFAASLSLMLRDASDVLDTEDFQTTCLGYLGASVGALVGLLVGFLARSNLSLGTSGTEAATLSISLLGAVSLVLTFFATSILISRNTIRDVAFLNNGRLPIAYSVYLDGNTKEQPGLIERCRELSLRYGLTKRESEVLVILARGNGLAKVQEELFISDGTAITHRNHIYKKMGIHSRQELLALVDGIPDE